MKRMLIATLVALAAMAFAVPASAETADPALTELIQARDEAQDEVDHLTALVATLQSEYDDAVEAREAAEGALADAEAAVTEAEQALEDAEEELQAAIDARDTLQGTLDTTGNPDGECFGNPTSARRIACEAAKAALPGAVQAVAQAEGAVAQAEDDLAQAEQVVEDAANALAVAEGVEGEALEALDAAKADLVAAQTALSAAQAQVDGYVAPAGDEVRHAGCKGIENAKAKSANSKGKSAEVLQGVSDKFGC